MFVKNNTQQSLFQPCLTLPDRLVKKLAASWAEVFRNDVLVHIPEDAFAHLYCDDNGRPNFPIALLVGLSLIKELRNYTDAQLFEAFHFDLLVHHALGIASGEVTMAERTMYNFRARAAGDAAVLQVFEDLTDRMISALSLCTEVQRLDSTQVSSNMVHLSRLQLFVQTMERFVAKLTAEQVAVLPEVIQERYVERAGYFADTTGANSRRRLGQAAQDLAVLVDHFAADVQVRDLPAYGLLVRLFGDQCEIQTDNGERVAILKDPSEIASDSLQAPSDPDATYSHHKGKGYQVQLAETCHPANPVELITHVAVEGAHESDHNALLPCIEATQQRDIGPDQLLADTSYSSGDNLVAAADKGVDLVAPTPGTVDPDNLSLADFAFEDDGMDIARCPEGHRPLQQGPNRKGDHQIVRFDAATCQACECAGACPAGKNHATVRFSINDYALAMSRVRQQTDAFKQSYKLRSGIEATNAALKTAHGFAKLWARGKARVTFAVLMKALALNFKRYARVQCARGAPVPA
jgi:hypothetical protein